MPLDLSSLQGTWRVIALEVEGTRVPPDSFRDAHVVVEGDRFESLGMGAPYGGTLFLADDGEPRELEIRFNHGPHAGLSSFGIHDLSQDVWLNCLGLVGRPRPRSFATVHGSGHALQVLQRVPLPA
jgi:uncharacterized protein (TIGR03067 family)